MLVPQKGVSSNYRNSSLLRVIANIVINSMILLILSADVIVWLYQQIYFTIAGIPKIKRSEYIKISRHKLPGLTVIQKWSCWYCEYTNSVIAWVKAVANQTEIYSCAIKYSHEYPGQEYQQKFYSQKEFESEK